MNRIFIIYFDVLVEMLLPVRLRGILMKAWLNALISPVKTLYGQFMTKRDANLYFLNHPPQVCYVEAVLNDRWDTAMRRIRIVDGSSVVPFWMGDDPDNNSDYWGDDGDTDLVYWGDDTDLTAGFDFVVEVPSFIVFDLTEMKATIDKYRMVGKHNYKIVTI